MDLTILGGGLLESAAWPGDVEDDSGRAEAKESGRMKRMLGDKGE